MFLCFSVKQYIYILYLNNKAHCLRWETVFPILVLSSWAQMILLPQPLTKLEPQVCTPAPHWQFMSFGYDCSEHLLSSTSSVENTMLTAPIESVVYVLDSQQAGYILGSYYLYLTSPSEPFSTEDWVICSTLVSFRTQSVTRVLGSLTALSQPPLWVFLLNLASK